jgi:ribose transport system permease protein
MIVRPNESVSDFLIRNATLAIFACVLIYFAAHNLTFLMPENLGNIVKQASFIGIAAIGMIFVLLTGGIDLSVGAVMYLAPMVAGFAMLQFGLPVPVGLLVAVAVGFICGALNAIAIVWLKVIPFIVTLASMFLFRGFGTWLNNSQQFDFSDNMRGFGLSSLLGIPTPVIIFGLVALFAHLVLSGTAYGRQLYAVGNDAEGARKAGLDVDWIIARSYIICSMCAALAGFVLIAQISRLDAGFGEGKEFDVIAAAVLGGASLFGGVGTAWGAVIGATLIQTVLSGLSFTGVNLYAQPIVQGLIIFIAVFVDGIRGKRLLAKLKRTIRPLESK